MPFETEEYKNDFSEASDREFDGLLKRQKRSFCVGTMTARKLTDHSNT